MKTLKRIIEWIAFLLTGKGAVADRDVYDGAVDFSGQGRDKYGR